MERRYAIDFDTYFADALDVCNRSSPTAWCGPAETGSRAPRKAAVAA